MDDFYCFSTDKTTIKVRVSKEKKLNCSCEGELQLEKKSKKASTEMPVKLQDLVTPGFQAI